MFLHPKLKCQGLSIIIIIHWNRQKIGLGLCYYVQKSPLVFMYNVQSKFVIGIYPHLSVLVWFIHYKEYVF